MHTNPTSCKKIKGSVFTPLETVMIRTPLLPIEFLEQWWKMPLRSPTVGNEPLLLADALEYDMEALQHYLSIKVADPVVQEALLFGSPDLSSAIASWTPGLSRKQDRRIQINVARYLARMTSRPTPFGLFAGVSIAMLGEKMDVQPGPLEHNRKQVQPDMRWLFRIIRMLEENPEVAQHLRFFRNSATFISGGRLYIPHIDAYGQATIEKMASLRATAAVMRTLDLTRVGMTLHELVQSLHLEYPEAKTKQIEGMLDSLRREGALLSELRPPLTGKSPVAYLLERIKDLPACRDTQIVLHDLLTLIATYESFPIGKGYKSLKDVFHVIKAPEIPTHSLLHVDMATDYLTRQFSASVAQEVALAAEIMARLSSQAPRYLHLAVYRRKFIERYGVTGEVPLLKLLDEDIGLGAPPTYQHPSGSKDILLPPLPNTTSRDRVLLALATSALNCRQIEIELDEKLLSQLQLHSHWEEMLPASLELYVSIASSSQAEIQRGNYQLIIGPRVGVSPAGRSFGRFCSILGWETVRFLAQRANEEAAHSPHCLFAEFTYLPLNGHAANIALRPALRQHEIALAVSPGVSPEHIIPLDDLSIGIRDDLFYIRSISHNAEVVLSETHLLNAINAPNICRFLSEIAGEGVLQMDTFYWGAAAQLPFLPRIRMGRIVLHPAEWHISPILLDIKLDPSPPDLASLYDHFREWRRQWHVPRYVYLVESDNRLLLDLENPLCILDLSEECRRKKANDLPVRLQEMIPDFSNLWAKGTQGRYLQEFIVPLLCHQPSPVAKKTLPVHIPSTTHERLRLPGSDWLYAKIYSGQTRHNDLLAGPVKSLMYQVQEKGLVNQWFFIRYADPEPHLRLRFYGEPATLLTEALPMLTKWGQDLVDEGLVQRIIFDTYEREIERYGGLDGILLAERIFAADSNAVMKTIALEVNKMLDLHPRDIALLMIEDLLSSLGLSPGERLMVYSMMRSQQEQPFATHIARFQQAFHTDAKSVQRLLSNKSWLQTQRGFPGLHTILQARATTLHSLKWQLETNDFEQKVFTSKIAFLSSCVHMHCNRLLGIDRLKEFEVLYYLERTLKTWEYYKPKGMSFLDQSGMS